MDEDIQEFTVLRFLDDDNDPMPAKVFRNRQRIMRAKHFIKIITPWRR